MNQTIFATLSLFLFFSISANAQSIDKEKENAGINKYFSSVYQAICQTKLSPTHSMATDASDAPQLERSLNKTDSIALNIDLKNIDSQNIDPQNIAPQADFTLYQQLAVIEWDQKFVVAINSDSAVKINGADSIIQSVPNLYCEERNLIMHHFNTHEWGSYLLEIAAEKGNTTELIIYPYDGK